MQSLTRRSFALTLPSAALTTVPVLAASLPAGADANLLALGRRWEAIQDQFEVDQAEFDAMSEAEASRTAAAREAQGDALFKESCALFDEIARTPARAMDGLVLKARILAHENDSEGRDEASIERALQHAHCFLDKAAFSLALDIVRLARSAGRDRQET